tara:strand:- start:436 stop:945 length:510 start_codon:yes stop_codon:yes gene_type:complete
MKILAGKFGGQKIKTSLKLSYRPTKSLVRKSIFDHLHPFSFSSVLDLFSGSGILGFEAASRGANTITFVEKNYSTFKLLKHNADLLKGPEYIFYRSNVFKFLNKRGYYDIIFADPPYLEYDLIGLTKIVLMHLNKKGKFILECETTQTPFMDANVKDYGNTRLLYWENI